MTRGDASPAALIGRDTETRALTERIDAAREGSGGAVLIRGAPGIGKTSVLEIARAHASATGHQVLSTTGVQSETHLPFAGLHQLLRPVSHDIDQLPASYAKALHSAFGLSDETVASPFLVALATLQLFAESAERAPLLLLVDDAQWLDGATAAALAFVARRLESDPIVLIAALRDGFQSSLLEAGIPELSVGTLTDAHAQALLEAHSPKIDTGLRGRVLLAAGGNPLALVELSTALRSTVDTDHGFWGSDLPLTTRLERAFADRLASLSPGARSFLRVAAADDRGLISELLTAATKLKGHEVTLEAANDASAAGLLEVEGLEIRFRHPLMRSAIHQAMTIQERQATHAALAATLESDLDRSAWHRAAATVGADEQVVAELGAVADRARRRGAFGVVIQSADRAARFARDPRQRGTLLIRAASSAWIMGRASEVRRLIDGIDEEQLQGTDRLHLISLREAFGRSPWSGASKLREFIKAAEQLQDEGDIDRGIELLFLAARRCMWSNPDEETHKALVSAASRFRLSEDDSRVLLAMASPVEHGAAILDHLSDRTADSKTNLQEESLRLGRLAQVVGDFAEAERFLEAYLAYCRSQGALGALAVALVLQSWTKFQLGDWRNAGSMASEASRLAEETGQQCWTGLAKLASATLAAYRGDIAVAERLCADGERDLLPSGDNSELAMVHWARGAAARADGRHDEAFQHLSRIFEPSDAYDPRVHGWVLVDLVEAAVHSGHERDAGAIVRNLEPIAARSRSPLLGGALQFARAALFPDDHEAAFRADAELATWPFTRARLQLAYGVWLRRQRRVSDSRAPLRAARDAFDALGAVPWGERARQELRASGETSRRRAFALIDALSSQELQIAQLAAQGLSNKEIGQQLFVSHRTISTHLYRIFPKLGITARSQLPTALQGRSLEVSS